MTNWYYASEAGEAIGPMDFVGLRRLAREGTISSDTYVFEEGGAEWRRLCDVQKAMLPPIPSKPPTLPLPYEQADAAESPGPEIESILFTHSQPTAKDFLGVTNFIAWRLATAFVGLCGMGGILCITVIGAPLGIFCLFLAVLDLFFGYPLAMLIAFILWQRSRIKQPAQVPPPLPQQGQSS